MAPTVFRPVGRIVGRGKIAGIFLPRSSHGKRSKKKRRK